MSEAEAAELRKRAEALLATPNEAIDQMPAESVRELIHELQVHEVELKIQNEELRQTQFELSRAHDRYSSLYAFAPVGYVTLNARGEVEEANLTVAKMLEVERGKLIGGQFAFFVKPEDREKLAQHQVDVFASSEKQVCEVALFLEGEAENVTIIRLESLLPDEQETDVPVCFTALIDITSQRTADDLRLEQHCYRVSEAEKHRIARQLHDDLGSFLKGVELHTTALAKDLEADGSESVKRAQMIADLLRTCIADARELAIGLHPISEPESLPHALERVAKFARESGIECLLKLPEDPVEIFDSEVANHLFRIAQEAVHNAIHNSGVSELCINLAIVEGSLTLSVRDNGSGFDLDAVIDGGIGIQIMKYRARAIGDALSIESGPQGTEVKCRVLMSNEALLPG